MAGKRIAPATPPAVQRLPVEGVEPRGPVEDRPPRPPAAAPLAEQPQPDLAGKRIAPAKRPTVQRLPVEGVEPRGTVEDRPPRPPAAAPRAEQPQPGLAGKHVTPAKRPTVQRLPVEGVEPRGTVRDQPPLQRSPDTVDQPPPVLKHRAPPQLDAGLLRRLTARGERRSIPVMRAKGLAAAEELSPLPAFTRDISPALRRRSRDQGVVLPQLARPELVVQRQVLVEESTADQPKVKPTAEEFLAALPLPPRRVSSLPSQHLQRTSQTTAPVEKELERVELVDLLDEEDMENLASEVYPIIKRILRTELERHSRRDLDL